MTKRSTYQKPLARPQTVCLCIERTALPWALREHQVKKLCCCCVAGLGAWPIVVFVHDSMLAEASACYSCPTLRSMRLDSFG